MLKVLLIDDEPFFLQGLEILIDWKKEGYEVVATASNGIEALNFLYEHTIDLIISDIKMPEMSGVTLLEKIHKEHISDAYFILLSAHSDFNYAQRAIRHNCTDYILKPINRESLIQVLQKIASINDIAEKNIETSCKMERAFLARNVIAVVSGKYDNVNLEYVKSNMRLSEGVRYIDVELDSINMSDKKTDEEKRENQRRLFNACLEYLKDDGSHCVFDVSRLEHIYDVGLVYCEYMSEIRNISEKDFFRKFRLFLRDKMQLTITIIIGEKVNNIKNISKSYGTVGKLRSFKGFRKKRSIYYYEDEAHLARGGNMLWKKSIDSLLKHIEHNDHKEIVKSVKQLYGKMKQINVVDKTLPLNINYLLFQLIDLASVQDNRVDQDEIFRLISESSLEEEITQGSKDHFTIFACKYGDYLKQLRSNVSRGFLGSVEKEIQENYSHNLTLKVLSEKYYVNSAYLGQIFRKKYGCSFKDYLNNCRLEHAAILLLRTDEKIYQIAKTVGYHDQDYFIRRFISAKGCTPSKYRKRLCNIDDKSYSLT